MKVLHLSSEMSWRGGEQQMGYFILASARQGVQSIVCAKKGSAFAKWCYEHKITYVEAGFKNALDLITILKIKRLAREESVDIIHCHSGKSHSLAYSAVLMGCRIPLIVHRRLYFPLKAFGYSLKKYKHSMVAAIICVSRTIANLVKQRLGNDSRVHMVYDGIDFERFSSDRPTKYLHQEFYISEHKKLIANVSALSPQKDYTTFILCAKEVLQTRHDCHFLIVGDGPAKKKLQNQVEHLGLKNHVSFTGFRKDVPSILRELSVFLITSQSEGLGTTIIDAMYNALPVIATKAGGIPELVVDHENGFLCEVGDCHCLAQNVIALLDNKELRRKMGANGRQRSLSFSQEQMVSKVLAIYKNVNRMHSSPTLKG